MKKSLVLLICITMLLIVGCASETPDESPDPVVMDGAFEVAEYEKFNSYASDNGLDGMLITFDGTLEKYFEVGTESSIYGYIVETSDGSWVVTVGGDIDGQLCDEELIKNSFVEGRPVKVYASYMGFSDLFHIPGGALVNGDNNNSDGQKIVFTDTSEILTYTDVILTQPEASESSPAPIATAGETKTPEIKTGSIIGADINLRSEPNTDSNVLTQVSEPQAVEIIEESGEWYKIRVDGQEGYIHGDYITTEDDAEPPGSVEGTEESAPVPNQTPAPPAASSQAPTSGGETTSQTNAVRKAEQYLDYTAFSRSGLIGQLEYEGFSTEDATYAVDNVQVDWMEQAVKKAEQYMDYTAFSREGLIGQLEYEGFTREQAEHGANSVGL